MLVSEHIYHASPQFIVSFLQPSSLELNFLLDALFILGASGVIRFLSSNKDIVGPLNAVDTIVEAVQVRLEQDFNSECLVHQTLDPGTHPTQLVR